MWERESEIEERKILLEEENMKLGYKTLKS
jgi:hypothetical protein